MPRGLRTALIALALGILPITVGIAATAALDPNSVAGAYTKRFRNSEIGGTTYMSTNVLRIIPLGPKAAFISTDLYFYNGHECGLSGIADVEGRELVYREKVMPGERQCVLRIQPSRTVIRMDEGEYSCSAYCGVRGSFSRASFSVSSRRKLSAADRAMGAVEIEAALKELK